MPQTVIFDDICVDVLYYNTTNTFAIFSKRYYRENHYLVDNMFKIKINLTIPSNPYLVRNRRFLAKIDDKIYIVDKRGVFSLLNDFTLSLIAEFNLTKIKQPLSIHPDEIEKRIYVFAPPTPFYFDIKKNKIEKTNWTIEDSENQYAFVTSHIYLKRHLKSIYKVTDTKTQHLIYSDCGLDTLFTIYKNKYILIMCKMTSEIKVYDLAGIMLNRFTLDVYNIVQIKYDNMGYLYFMGANYINIYHDDYLDRNYFKNTKNI